MKTLVLALLLISSTVLADDAKTLKQEGLAAAQAKDWELARQKFEASYGIEPDPFTLYNLAAAQEHTDRLIAARASYAKFLDQTKPGQGDRFRAAAKKQLPILDGAIPTLRIKTVGFSSAAIIELDGRALVANELTAPFAIDPGKHVVLARQDAHVLARQELTSARGAHDEITLTAPPPKVDKPPPPPVVVRPVEKEPEKRGALRSPLLWTGVAVAVIGGAAAYYFLYYNKTDPTPGTLGRGIIDL